MVRRAWVVAASVVGVAALVGSSVQAASADEREPRVVGTASLPDVSLGKFSNGLIPGSVDDDREVDLGGIGSDIFPAGKSGEFWTVTDRGPNGQIKVDGSNRRTFPVPGFDPAIVKVKVAGKKLKVIDAIPITTRHGKPVTGLPNQESRDELPYTYDASTRLPLDPNGLDTEGIVRAYDGTFWLVDEYSPSLVHVSSRGQVIARYVPKGLNLQGADYPVIESLPAMFLTRKINRGFEGLAQLPGGDLVLALQSPLSNPSKKVGEASLNTRLLRFSPRAGKVTAEYAYRFDPVGVVDPGEDDTSELKISSIVAAGPETLLVEERTDNAARLQRVVLRPSANILGSKWDDAATTPSHEASTDVPALPKTLFLDLNTVKGAPKKIEGVALLPHNTLVVINDNDFGMTDGPDAFDADGNLVDSGIETTLVTIRLH
ncbi:phytase-like protein with esterase activity [Kribbella sp. VKM Ac-2569]|uniref:esterase-like activity of phytase family protein n=1 Tax=Kribbella sp. VKM Ac-2569 TaxID=2512220 RepID=UPI00102ACC7D|nr:esterase-like activity of phytase family protein [Kribbella sp. VKM Ac-2569]RZT28598.1 phytase-like protein with esterase activity [Kribbella sp. VKM Ac-2569]